MASRVVIDWGEAQQQVLLRFLDDLTSSDPTVQAGNLQQLQSLSQCGSALTAALDVLCGSQHPLQRRQAAASVAKQLLKQDERFISTVDASECGRRLLGVLTESRACHEGSPGRQQQQIYGAAGSVIAAIVRAEAGTVAKHTLPHPPQWPAVLLTILRERVHLLQQQQGQVVSGSSNLQPCWEIAGIAAVAQILCEDCAVQLREGVGSTPEGVYVLCDLFQKMLDNFSALQRAGVAARNDDPITLSATVSLAVAILRSLTSCMEEGVLPLEDPVKGGRDADGAALASLQKAVQIAAQLHTHVCETICGDVLSLIAQMEGQPLGEGGFLRNAAQLIACVADYVRVTVLVESLANTNVVVLASVLPAVQRFLHLFHSSAAGGTNDIVDNTVQSSLALLSEIAHLGGDGATALSSSTFAWFQEALPILVVDLHSIALVPSALAFHAIRSEECTLHIPDDASSVKVVMGRTEGNSTKKHKSSGKWESQSCEDERDRSDDEGVEEEWGNSALRESIAWLLNCLSFGYPNLLPAALVCPCAQTMASCAAILTPSTSPASFSSVDAVMPQFLAVEAALFLVNEVAEELLCTEGMNAAVVQELGFMAVQAAQALESYIAACPSSFLRQQPQQSHEGSSGVPCFVRVQCVRYLSRLVSGACQALAQGGSASQCGDGTDTPLALPSSSGAAQVLQLCIRLLQVEESKQVQVECIRAVQLILGSSLRSLATASCAQSQDLESEDEDDSEEEYNDGCSAAAEASLTSIYQFISGNSSSASSVSMLANAVTTLLDSAIFSRLQLGGRTAVYHLLSEVFPLFDTVCKSCADEGGDGTALMNSALVQSSLEALAQQYTHLQDECGGDGTACSLTREVETVTVLNCLCDVCASSGSLMAPALVWVVGVCGNVLLRSRQSQFLLCNSMEGSMGVNTGITSDVCMLALDLLSSACDALLDRDTLTSLPDAQSVAVAAEHLSALQSAFRMNESGQTVVSLCVGLLSQCLSDRQQQASMGDGSDTTVEVRRACFALLYDSLYILQDDTQLLRDVLASEVCVLELHIGASGGTDSSAGVTEYEMSSAVSNAMLCFAELMYLLRCRGSSINDCSSSSSSNEWATRYKAAWCMMLQCLAEPGRWLSSRELKLNLVSACATLGAVLGQAGCALNAAELHAFVGIMAKDMNYFLPAGTVDDGDCENVFECVQMQWGVGVTLQAALLSESPLPLHGAIVADLVKLLSLVARCLAKITCNQRKRQRAPIPAAALLLSVWRPLAHLSLSNSQASGAVNKSALQQVRTTFNC